jgi:hypothetical protein
MSNGCKRHPEDAEVPQDNPLVVANIDTDLLQLSDSMVVWLDSLQLYNGLVETSYASNFVSLYDNALAALVFAQSGQIDRAERILQYFQNRLQTEMLSGNGGYFQFRNAQGQLQGNRWLGDNAWLLIAINNYEHITGDTQFSIMRDALVNWIKSQQDTDGGLWGGSDISGAHLGKVTEGMIDAFNAVPGYEPFHANLLQYFEAQRWDTSEQLLVSWPSSSYYYALDNFSWGYCTFEGFSLRVLDEANRFENTQYHALSGDSITGYCFDEDRDAIWMEGTGQMAVAFSNANRLLDANRVLHELQKAATSQAAFPGAMGLPYASNIGTGYGGSLLWAGADEMPCTAATTWFIMACHRFDPMHLNYAKNIPVEDRFW